MQLGMIGLGRMGANSSALFGRFASRGNADYAHRVLSAMRKQFGGHLEKPQGGS